MKYSLIGLMMLAGIATASAQTSVTGTTSSPAVAPRNPGGPSAGTTPPDRRQMDQTVDSIDRNLLNAEKDRPSIPGQAPSPSQTTPSDTGTSQTARPHG